MDIKKIVRKFLSEQEGEENAPNPVQQLTRAQRELLNSLTTKWKGENPQITDEQAAEIYIKYRQILPSIQSEKQQAVRAFILRGNGKYTINDLKNISKISLKDLLLFLLEYTKFRVLIGDGVPDEEKEQRRLDAVFNVRPPGGAGPGGITPEKIEASKQMWESDENLIISGDNFRVYDIKTRQQSVRMGYYYQEKLRELVVHNVDNGRGRTTISPWCLVGRSTDQTVYYKNNTIIRGVGNAYTGYRPDYSLYYIIDENKDLFGNGGEYYIGVVLASRGGRYQVASMYNGEYNISPDDLFKIYPQLRGNLEKLTYRNFDLKAETNDGVPLTIVDRMNEDEGSEFAFWLQGPDEKSQYIAQGRYLKNPKSWETMTDDLRTEYIENMTEDNILQKVGTDEFFRAIIKSGNQWKSRLDYKLVRLKKGGIGYLTDNFMKAEYAPDFFGAKNQNVRIYKKNHTNYYGIYNVNDGEWVTKDGISYDCFFTKNILTKPDNLLSDKQTNIRYLVTEFQSSDAKFYILKNLKEVGKNFNVYIMSEKKYRELKEKLESQVDGGEPQGLDDKNDIDIAEQIS